MNWEQVIQQLPIELWPYGAALANADPKDPATGRFVIQLHKAALELRRLESYVPPTLTAREPEPGEFTPSTNAIGWDGSDLDRFLSTHLHPCPGNAVPISEIHRAYTQSYCAPALSVVAFGRQLREHPNRYLIGHYTGHQLHVGNVSWAPDFPPTAPLVLNRNGRLIRIDPVAFENYRQQWSENYER